MIHRLEEFKNLLAMAMADGSLTQREIEFLSERALRWGLSNHEFSSAVEHALRHQGEVAIPRKRADRLEMLREMLRMMAADGELADIEKRLFAIAAAAMNVSGAQLDELIDTILGETRTSAAILPKLPRRKSTKTTTVKSKSSRTPLPPTATSKSEKRRPTASKTKRRVDRGETPAKRKRRGGRA